jgi:hypothetical protein
MPRRTATEGEKLAERAKNARWRLAVRHPAFRQELRALSALVAGPDPATAGNWEGPYGELLKKWRFGEVPRDAIRQLATADPGDEVRLLEGFTNEVRAYPVSVGELDRGRRIVRLVIDLDNPLDLLMSLTERELRDLAREYRMNPSQRRRFDKLDFYLEVFDRYERGETFPQIARAVKRSPSSVKSAFIAAQRNIYGLLPEDDASLTSGREVRLAAFDKDTHMQRCPVCRAASSLEELCQAARAWARQDEVKQRERLGTDTVRDVPDVRPLL